MSQFLVNLQRAIAQTDRLFHVNAFGADPTGKIDSTQAIQSCLTYSHSWQDVALDLEYGLKLSETACREHLLLDC